jgi:hypothetical protein
MTTLTKEEAYRERVYRERYEQDKAERENRAMWDRHNASVDARRNNLELRNG